LNAAAVERAARRALERDAVRIEHGRIRVWRLERGRRRWSPADAAGRWNDVGVPLVYASTTAALAALEGLAHLAHGEGTKAHRIVSFETAVRPGELAWLPPDSLPTHWKRDKALTRAIGAAFCSAQAWLALLVPSALAPGEQNVLLNPLHDGWGRWRSGAIERPFRFDRRLVDTLR
jgi:RES domain-containing protein